MEQEMSLNEKLSKLGFKDVFEIVPGLIYEFISNGRRIRMSVGNAVDPRAPSVMAFFEEISGDIMILEPAASVEGPVLQGAVALAKDLGLASGN
ncbi:MAG: hypothetical protein WB810_09585 [Candidatus Cybelea sp.]